MSVPVFVDTSAYYAVLDHTDPSHPAAAAAWGRLLDEMAAEHLEALTHGGVVVETAALVQHRLGMTAVRTFLDEYVPASTVVWVDAELHDQAAAALLAAGRRQVSLVDWTSFVVMRRRGIEQALAFDDHFLQQGFELFR